MNIDITIKGMKTWKQREEASKALSQVGTPRAAAYKSGSLCINATVDETLLSTKALRNFTAKAIEQAALDLSNGYNNNTRFYEVRD